MVFRNEYHYVRIMSSLLIHSIMDIITDTSDNIYVCGYYTGAPAFGTFLPYSTDADWFVAKFAPGGAPLWSFGFVGNSSFDSPKSIAAGSGD